MNHKAQRNRDVMASADMLQKAANWLADRGFALLYANIGVYPEPRISVAAGPACRDLKRLGAVTVGQTNVNGRAQIRWEGSVEGCRVEWLEDAA